MRRPPSSSVITPRDASPLGPPCPPAARPRRRRGLSLRHARLHRGPLRPPGGRPLRGLPVRARDGGRPSIPLQPGREPLHGLDKPALYGLAGGRASGGDSREALVAFAIATVALLFAASVFLARRLGTVL